jgi:integrase
MGEQWQDRNLVFCNRRGGFLHDDHLRRKFYRVLERASLPRIRIHDLRHSAATILLCMGVNIKVVQELLGHSKIATTLDVYGHVLPTMQKDAASKLDDLFGG